jgi:hypothetical protein
MEFNSVYLLMKDNQTVEVATLIGYISSQYCYCILEMPARHWQEESSAITGKNAPSKSRVKVNICLQPSQENELHPANKM